MTRNAPTFPQVPNGLYNKLQQAVKAYFAEKHINTTGNWKLYGKAIVIACITAIVYAGLLLVPNTWYFVRPMYMLLGFTYALIGFNITHDANHGSFFQNRKLNRILGYSLNFIGGDRNDWLKMHNQAHHTYTNIQGHDHDTEYFGILRFSPHQNLRWYHKYQHLYCFVIYAVASVHLLGIGRLPIWPKRFEQEKERLPRQELIIKYLFKLIHFGMIIIIPLMLHSRWIVLLGYLFFHISLGITIYTVFQLAHIVEDTDFPLPTGNPASMKDEWALHQLRTTVNFGTTKKTLTWIVGGLNYQIEHHLFPKIAHTHYPAISKLIKKVCREENIPYHEYKSMGSALRSHLHHLYMMGRQKIQAN